MPRSETRRPGGAIRRVPRLIGLLGAALLAACELPSELPKWNTTWVVPGDTTSISIGELLPSGVTITPDESAFAVSLGAVSFSRSVGQLCPPCAQLNGLVVPKPEFTTTFETDIALPGAVSSITLSGGQIRVQLQHDFTFDPLRPSSTARGYLVVALASGSTQVAKDSISGNDTAFGAGTTLTRTLAIQPGTVTGPLTLSVKIHSPAGDPVVMDSNRSFTVTTEAGEVLASEAKVQLGTEEITLDERELDLEDVDTSVTDNIKGGALRLQIDNPFDIAGAVTVRITAPDGTNIVKNLQLAPGETEQRLELTQSDLRSILGKAGVRLSGTGSVSGAAGGTTVRPTSAVEIGVRFEITVGGREEA